MDVNISSTKHSPTRGWYWAKEAQCLKDLSVAMTKNEDIWFYDSNDFTVVYRPNVFLHIAELNKQATAVNFNAFLHTEL